MVGLAFRVLAVGSLTVTVLLASGCASTTRTGADEKSSVYTKSQVVDPVTLDAVRDAVAPAFSKLGIELVNQDVEPLRANFHGRSVAGVEVWIKAEVVAPDVTLVEASATRGAHGTWLASHAHYFVVRIAQNSMAAK